MNEFDKMLSRIIGLIMEGVNNTEDERQLEIYQSILEYIGILIGVIKEDVKNV